MYICFLYYHEKFLASGLKIDWIMAIDWVVAIFGLVWYGFIWFDLVLYHMICGYCLDYLACKISSLKIDWIMAILVVFGLV